MKKRKQGPKSIQFEYQEERIKRRSPRIYKKNILESIQGNRKLELWINFLFGNHLNPNESTVESESVVFLPLVLVKIIFEYYADPWDPYTVFDEMEKKKKEKNQFQFQQIESSLFIDIFSSLNEKITLDSIVPFYSNSSKKTFLFIVLTKNKRTRQIGEEIINYSQIQIQQWDVARQEKCKEINMNCFPIPFYIDVKVDLLQNKIIIFSFPFFDSDNVVYIYHLETFTETELTIPYLYNIAGIYKNNFIYANRVGIYKINMIDLITKEQKEEIVFCAKGNTPARIRLLKYHPNLILLFHDRFLMRGSQSVEIWNHSVDSKQPVAIFENCDEIWEFFSFPFEIKCNTKPEDNIILGVYRKEEKKNCAKIEIWKMDRNNQHQLHLIQTSFLHQEKYLGENFLQISMNYFLCFTTFTVFIYEIKSFLQIKKLEFYPKEILTIFFSPIDDYKLWITFRSGEIKIF